MDGPNVNFKLLKLLQNEHSELHGDEASNDTILAARDDDLIIPKLQFFLSVARSFNTFLTKYQTDEPVLPFLAKDLKEILMVRNVITVELLSSFECD